MYPVIIRTTAELGHNNHNWRLVVGRWRRIMRARCGEHRPLRRLRHQLQRQLDTPLVDDIRKLRCPWER